MKNLFNMSCKQDCCQNDAAFQCHGYCKECHWLHCAFTEEEFKNLRPLRRITLKDSKGDESLEVRNWLDTVEDKINDALEPHMKEITKLMAENLTHTALFARPLPDYEKKLEIILTKTINNKQ